MINNKCFIIAELSANHGGKLDVALETIRAAIMGRLVEINKINWEIEEKTSSTLYSLPSDQT